MNKSDITETNMKVCYFGNYDPEYSRNSILIKGLRKNGVEVLECNGRGYWELAKKLRSFRGRYDVLVVGYSNSRLVVALSKFLSDKKIIWNPLYSIYESLVLERQLTSKNSLKSWFYYLLDWLGVKLSDVILLDTNENITFFCNSFGSGNKYYRVWVGADEDILKPVQASNETFTVHFHGKSIPFHGINVIIKAAKILENYPIRFVIIGAGQTSDADMRLAASLDIKNVSFIPRISYSELAKLIGKADICLGVFGEGDRVDRVIPNKIFEAVASGKPVITASSKAAKEFFTDGKDILFCERGNPESLACKIIDLYCDPALRKELVKNSLVLYNQLANSKAIGKDLVAYLRKII